MGWTGSGLGSSNQGIEEPISAGDVREGSSKFLGIGAEVPSSSSNDPYENFRRSRGQAFMERIVKGKDDK